jgi:hypothetical protein
MHLLAERYGHDVGALDMVFWHILTRLSYYRELHMKSKQLMEVRAACVVQQLA